MGIHTIIRITDKVLGTTVAEGDEKPTTKAPLAENPTAVQVFTIVGVACFIGIVLPYLTCDLWIDECITLDTYVIRKPFSSCFLSYAVANNHILYTAMLWIWANFFKLVSESALRLPCLLMMLAAAYAMYTSCRRFFKNPAAGMYAALLLLFSPVYIGFCWQLRGYSMSIMFASFVVSGVLKILQSNRRAGTALFALGAVPLPAVVPTNLMFSYCMILFLIIFYYREKRLPLNVLFLALLTAIATFGMVIYVPIFAKLEHALATTAGWSSGVNAAGHWMLAVASHAALFPLVCIALRSTKGVEPPAQKISDVDRLRKHLPMLAGCSIAPVIIVLLIRAPFPRVFLPFFVPMIVASMAFYEPRLVRLNRNFYILMCLILANFLVWTRVCGMLEKGDRYRGVIRQNLLQQFYGANNDASRALQAIRSMPKEVRPPKDVRIFVEFEFYLTMTKYWPEPDHIECLGWPKVPLKLERRDYPWIPKLAIGYNAELLRRKLMKELQSDIRLTPLMDGPGMSIFKVDMPRLPGMNRPSELKPDPSAQPISY